MSGAARILLADDDPIMRELAQAQLHDAGYQVLLAENGAEALELITREPVDLLISDLDMPELTGFELTAAIRNKLLLVDLPVIVITASDQGDAVEKAFAAGATSFLAKPINWTLFNHAVRFVLRANDDQRALREARDQAEAGAKFKDNLLSVMSHELRTPLNAIIGFGQIISDHFERSDDAAHQEYAEYIVDGGRRLLGSVSDMLLASDARSGPLVLNECDVIVSDLVDEALSLLKTQLEASNAKVLVRHQDPNIEICCDRSLLVKALTKLIENSLKFGPKGVVITVGTALTKTGALAVLVKDSGPGIDRDKLESLSQPFTQSDMSIRRSKEGLGLGLPLAHAIANAHEAVLKPESTLGDGTRIVMVLPASRVITSTIKVKLSQSAA